MKSLLQSYKKKKKNNKQQQQQQKKNKTESLNIPKAVGL